MFFHDKSGNEITLFLVLTIITFGYEKQILLFLLIMEHTIL